MNVKKIICIILAVLIAGSAVYGAVRLRKVGEESLPVGLGIEDMKDAAQTFCNALNDGDLATVEDMISGYSALHLYAEPKDPVNYKLIDCLRISYQSELVGEGTTEGMSAKQDIKVGYFAANLAIEDTKAYTQTLYDERLVAAQSNEELYDEKGNLLESVALEMYAQAVDEIIGSSDKYMVEETITLEMVYENSRWEVILTDDLVRILLGGIG